MRVQDLIYREPSELGKKIMWKISRKTPKRLRVVKKRSYIPDNGIVDEPVVRGL